MQFCVTPELRVEIRTRIREEWFNGKAYNGLHGQRLKNLPERPEHQPNGAFLQWHHENCFRP
jgi:putative restriction endonuclease